MSIRLTFAASNVQALCAAASLTLIRGAEISCRWYGPEGPPISLHLLAYLFDPDHAALRDELDRVKASRLTRGRRIVRDVSQDIVEYRVVALAHSSPSMRRSL